MPDTEQKTKIVLVAAVARNGAIGREGRLLWHEPADMRHFRAVTLGSPVLMGRKTWDSLPAPFRPLPGRRNLVLTRRVGWQPPGAEAVASWREALDRLAGEPRICVIGGAEIYRLAIELADELVLTEIDADLPADAFFPMWDRACFDGVAGEARSTAEGMPYRFVTHRRIKDTPDGR